MRGRDGRRIGEAEAIRDTDSGRSKAAGKETEPVVRDREPAGPDRGKRVEKNLGL